MDEAQQPRMQCLPRKAANHRTNRTGMGHCAPGAGAVNRIADQRMAAMRQMHADLVRAAGKELALEQRRTPIPPGSEAPLDPVASNRRLAPALANNGHLLAVDDTAADIAADFA